MLGFVSVSKLTGRTYAGNSAYVTGKAGLISRTSSHVGGADAVFEL